MNSVCISPPNAILFVMDPKNKGVTVPQYLPGELTAMTESCISVGTRASVDGEVEISMIFSKENPINFCLATEGEILVPSGKVAVVTSEFEKLIEIDVQTRKISASIWVDDLRNPAKVHICLCQ